MFEIVTLGAIILALMFMESTGALEFETSSSTFIAALVCLAGNFGISTAAALMFPNLDVTDSMAFAVAVSFGIPIGATMASLLVAWATVPGVHIRRFSGVILAAILIVGFRYVVSLILAQILI